MHYRKTQLIAGLVTTLLLLVVIGMMGTAQSAGDLPDRTPPSPQKSGNGNDRPLGTHIELVAPGRAGYWSVVQWQDGASHWHDVEGWQGTLDNRGVRRWWVEAKDFGTGPFRWVVRVNFASTDSNSISPTFTLPDGATDPLIIRLP